jgi:hypothetical protein
MVPEVGVSGTSSANEHDPMLPCLTHRSVIAMVPLSRYLAFHRGCPILEPRFLRPRLAHVPDSADEQRECFSAILRENLQKPR